MKFEILVQTWKVTFPSMFRHLRPLSLCWSHHLHYPMPAPSLRDSNICWLTDWLIDWSGARGVNWLIDCLEVGVAFISSPGERSSGGPHSSVMSNTVGEDGEMKSCGFITKTWGGGGHVWRKSQPRWEHAEQTMETRGQKGSAWTEQKR